MSEQTTGCAERAALRERARHERIEASGVRPRGVGARPADDDRWHGRHSPHERGDASAIFGCANHLELVEAGWQLAEMIDWKPESNVAGDAATSTQTGTRGGQPTR
jgi:hypothetical protein